MQLKINVPVLLLLTVQVIIPAVRADSIRAPAQPVRDQMVLNRTAAITPVLAKAGVLKGALDEDVDGDRDRDRKALPEPGSIVPLVLLAAGVLLLRRRLSANV